MLEMSVEEICFTPKVAHVVVGVKSAIDEVVNLMIVQNRNIGFSFFEFFDEGIFKYKKPVSNSTKIKFDFM